MALSAVSITYQIMGVVAVGLYTLFCCQPSCWGGLDGTMITRMIVYVRFNLAHTL